jgi:hypothetical protein
MRFFSLADLFRKTAISKKEDYMKFIKALSLIFILAGWCFCQMNPDLVNLPDNTWRKLNPSANPSISDYPPFGHPKAESQLTFDEKNGLVIWFGGCSAGYSNNTWVFSVTDNTWTRHNGDENWGGSSSLPKGQCHYSITYDSDAGMAIKHTGISAGGPDRYTWGYDAAAKRWTRLYSMPDGNAHIQALAYDRDNKKTVLFGGFYGWNGGTGDQTWVFDYASKTWTRRNPSQHPSSRGWASFDFHQKLGKFVLFSGAPWSGTIKNDTWLYDYATNTWEQISPANPPPARIHGNMVYDPNNEVMILFGGRAGNYQDKGPSLNDTWVLDLENNRWINMKPSSPPSGAKVYKPAFDPVNNVMIIVKSGSGYSTETWVYRYKKQNTTRIQGISLARTNLGLHVSPNPFHSITAIKINGGLKIEDCRLKIFDIKGEMVKDFSSIYLPSGRRGIPRTLYLQAEGLFPGVYFIRTVMGKRTFSKKVVLVK